MQEKLSRTKFNIIPWRRRYTRPNDYRKISILRNKKRCWLFSDIAIMIKRRNYIGESMDEYRNWSGRPKWCLICLYLLIGVQGGSWCTIALGHSLVWGRSRGLTMSHEMSLLLQKKVINSDMLPNWIWKQLRINQIL